MSPGGPGVHKMMLYHFSHQITKGIMYGTYVNGWNELFTLQHSMEHVSYLDATADYLRSSAPVFGATSVSEPFAPFISAGHYSGLYITPRLLCGLFFPFMAILDSYLQKDFQLACDEGNSSDHTFHFASRIKAPAFT
jgi:hypothetical protein